ncbi:unnamed protein product [marine sediment metagenome]|uniref:Uncharacterized protein n=1 Tax=marine sediment metagenome TaxID=412755 RepID=X0WDF4_9ZZZZ
MDEIIKKLDRAQDLLEQNRISEAKTTIYEAECMARDIKDGL